MGLIGRAVMGGEARDDPFRHPSVSQPRCLPTSALAQAPVPLPMRTAAIAEPANGAREMRQTGRYSDAGADAQLRR